MVISCSNPELAGGGTIETTNGFVALIIGPDSLPVSGADVRVRTNDYLSEVSLSKEYPAGQYTTVSGPDGTVKVGSLAPGDYIIEFNDTRSSAFMQRMTIGSEDEPQDLGTVQLKPYSAIRGGADSAHGKSFVLVYGLERIVPVAGNGAFEIGDLPEGTFTLRLIEGRDDPAPLIIDSIETKAGEFTDVRYRDWEFRADIYINTSVTGAGVTDDVYRFPLLLRIDNGGIDFSGAAEDGRDIRLAKADGTPLPFEIELWDKVNQIAVVWVSVDTIYGNNSEQRIFMYWGNPNVSALPSGEPVFATENGFAGVWHMTSPTTGVYPDATANANTGTRDLHLSEQGIIGHAAAFTDSGQYIDCGAGSSLALQNEGMVSAWAKLSDLSDRYNWLVAKKESIESVDGYALECNPAMDGGFVTLIAQDSQLVRGYFEEMNLEAEWIHVAAVFKADSAAVFYNGIDITNYFVGRLNVMPGTAPLLIGGKGNDWMKGAIDEVRVEHVARGSAWIKLSYETQREEQATVIFDFY